MISHVFLGIGDFDRAYTFYSKLMADLGLTLKFYDAGKPWAGWIAKDSPRPIFVIGKPFDGKASDPGNGHMVALLASDREAVKKGCTTALATGGICEGEPGLRRHYHPDYYGAYFRDPDGNKICICCHEADQPRCQLVRTMLRSIRAESALCPLRGDSMTIRTPIPPTSGH